MSHQARISCCRCSCCCCWNPMENYFDTQKLMFLRNECYCIAKTKTWMNEKEWIQLEESVFHYSTFVNSMEFTSIQFECTNNAHSRMIWTVKYYFAVNSFSGTTLFCIKSANEIWIWRWVWGCLRFVRT